MTYCDSQMSRMPYRMPTQAAAAQSHGVDIILPPNVPHSAARMLVELFDAANDLITGMTYEVSVLTLAQCPTENPRHWARRSAIFWGDIHARWTLRHEERKRVQQILRLAARAVLVGGAVFLLSDTGQSGKHDLAIHPNFMAAATEENLKEPQANLHFATSGSISSAISGFAALRLMLELVGTDHGQFIGAALSEYLGLSADPPRTQSRVSLRLRKQACGDKLIDSSLDLMQEHIEEPLKIEALAREQGVSTRKLQRRFLEKTGTGPLTAYRSLRLERARQLLVHTNLSLSEIIVATGFGTHSNLARWFRREFGVSPLTLRQNAFQGNGLISVS